MSDHPDKDEMAVEWLLDRFADIVERYPHVAREKLGEDVLAVLRERIAARDAHRRLMPKDSCGACGGVGFFRSASAPVGHRTTCLQCDGTGRVAR